MSVPLSQALMVPVWVRACAQSSAPGLGFVDRAAEQLIARVGVAGIPPQTLRSCQSQLQRTAWVDGQVLSCLAHYPDSLGLELGAGLNTRFHRLSAKLGWPRFGWMDFNSIEVATIAWQQLPPTDNYQFIGCDPCLDNWFTYVSAHQRRPLIVVIERQSAYVDEIDFKRLFKNLFYFSCENHSPVFVVVATALHKGWFGKKKNCCVQQSLKALVVSDLDKHPQIQIIRTQFKKWSGLFITFND